MRKIGFIVMLLIMLASPTYATEVNTTATNTTGVYVEGGVDVDVEGDGSNVTVSGDSYDVDIPDETKTLVNSHLQPLNTPLIVTTDYNGPVFKDHKYQREILYFMLSANKKTDSKDLRPFVIERKKGFLGIFVKDSSKSSSNTIAKTEFKEQKSVYVFIDKKDLRSHVSNYQIVGFTDTFSDGDATLLDCFDQAVIDAGEMGGNIIVVLKVDFMAAVESSTIGLGTSGAGGFMHGSNEASVYGAALGYAKSRATPQTDPFIHCMVLYSDKLAKMGVTK